MKRHRLSNSAMAVVRVPPFSMALLLPALFLLSTVDAQWPSGPSIPTPQSQPPFNPATAISGQPVFASNPNPYGPPPPPQWPPQQQQQWPPAPPPQWPQQPQQQWPPQQQQWPPQQQPQWPQPPPTLSPSASVYTASQPAATNFYNTLNQRVPGWQGEYVVTLSNGERVVIDTLGRVLSKAPLPDPSAPSSQQNQFITSGAAPVPPGSQTSGSPQQYPPPPPPPPGGYYNPQGNSVYPPPPPPGYPPYSPSSPYNAPPNYWNNLVNQNQQYPPAPTPGPQGSTPQPTARGTSTGQSTPTGNSSASTPMNPNGLPPTPPAPIPSFFPIFPSTTTPSPFFSGREIINAEFVNYMGTLRPEWIPAPPPNTLPPAAWGAPSWQVPPYNLSPGSYPPYNGPNGPFPTPYNPNPPPTWQQPYTPSYPFPPPPPQNTLGYQPSPPFQGSSPNSPPGYNSPQQSPQYPPPPQYQPPTWPPQSQYPNSQYPPYPSPPPPVFPPNANYPPYPPNPAYPPQNPPPPNQFPSSPSGQTNLNPNLNPNPGPSPNPPPPPNAFSPNPIPGGLNAGTLPAPMGGMSPNAPLNMQITNTGGQGTNPNQQTSFSQPSPQLTGGPQPQPQNPTMGTPPASGAATTPPSAPNVAV